MAIKVAEYIVGKKRCFASVRENLPTRWKGNDSNPLFLFPDMRRNVFLTTFSGVQFSFKFNLKVFVNLNLELTSLFVL